MSEFNLSNKIEGMLDEKSKEIKTLEYIYVEDVKEFIERLKDELSDFNTKEYYTKVIDKLAGDKLTQRDTNTQTNGEVKDE